MNDNSWLAASAADIKSVRAMLDTHRLRVRLVLLVSGTDARLNVSKIARELGCGRNQVARLIAEVSAELRAQPGLHHNTISANGYQRPKMSEQQQPADRL
jgi:hypothetical protein